MILAKDKLEVLAKAIEKALPKGGVIILEGDLAAGKTTFVNFFAHYLGLDDGVSSPTFSIQNCYGDTLFHYDIYNHGFEHFLSSGLFEELEKEGYHFIEWGDENLAKLLQASQLPSMHILIEYVSEDSRMYSIETIYKEVK